MDVVHGRDDFDEVCDLVFGNAEAWPLSDGGVGEVVDFLRQEVVAEIGGDTEQHELHTVGELSVVLFSQIGANSLKEADVSFSLLAWHEW